MIHPHPPKDWPQKVGPRAPLGRDDESFEVYVDAEVGGRVEYQVNLTTLEVFTRRGSGWYAPGWLELPRRVRTRIWSLHEEAERARSLRGT